MLYNQSKLVLEGILTSNIMLYNQSKLVLEGILTSNIMLYNQSCIRKNTYI